MSIKLLQQIWRIPGISVERDCMLIPYMLISGSFRSAAKQLNRTLKL